MALRSPGPEHQVRLRAAHCQPEEDLAGRRVGSLAQAPPGLQGIDRGNSVHLPKAAEKSRSRRAEAEAHGGHEEPSQGGSVGRRRARRSARRFESDTPLIFKASFIKNYKTSHSKKQTE